MFPQTSVFKANEHKVPSVGTPVQVAVVRVVVVGQLPQFDARTLYLIAGQFGATGFHLNLYCLKLRSLRMIDTFSGGGKGSMDR